MNNSVADMRLLARGITKQKKSQIKWKKNRPCWTTSRLRYVRVYTFGAEFWIRFRVFRRFGSGSEKKSEHTYPNQFSVYPKIVSSLSISINWSTQGIITLFSLNIERKIEICNFFRSDPVLSRQQVFLMVGYGSCFSWGAYPDADLFFSLSRGWN